MRSLIFCLKLKPIEYLLGTTAKVGEVIVLGMLTQLKEVFQNLFLVHIILDLAHKMSKELL
jgi:hypothetical protein